MDQKIKSISSLITAFETRNELLHEEIKRNEEAIKKMEQELLLIEDDNKEELKVNDKNVEMVA